ncbi:MAG TPA: hypothetical protein VGV89_07005 [Thermoplasmata archaeon]|nr:hypothetical protein [Thermoplasmata archaeon]
MRAGVSASEKRVLQILGKAKILGREYYSLTGKPMGITGEVAEYEASRLLGVRLLPARNDGYDALQEGSGGTRRIQIKGRALPDRYKSGERIGKLDSKKEWDSAILVILDREFETREIWEATRRDVLRALSKPGSKARNERGQLSVASFKRIALRRWPP